MFINSEPAKTARNDCNSRCLILFMSGFILDILIAQRNVVVAIPWERDLKIGSILSSSICSFSVILYMLVWMCNKFFTWRFPNNLSRVSMSDSMVHSFGGLRNYQSEIIQSVCELVDGCSNRVHCFVALCGRCLQWVQSLWVIWDWLEEPQCLHSIVGTDMLNWSKQWWLWSGTSNQSQWRVNQELLFLTMKSKTNH